MGVGEHVVQLPDRALPRRCSNVAALEYEHMFVYGRGMPTRTADQLTVLAKLLDAHPRMLDATKLPERERDAVRMLVQDGLATTLGDLAGASRAAVRYANLTAG
jgi:hypothetical protein